MIPQIIFLAYMLVSLMFGSYMHNKKREGTYNVWATLIANILTIGLLYWGGFFDVMIK